LLLLMVGMLGVLAYGLASAATTVDISVPSGNERYFSPNGDEQDDTVTGWRQILGVNVQRA
jgi:hypothetical protein